MQPVYNTITNNPDGLKKYNEGIVAFKSLPSVINENFNEGLSSEEMESIALMNSIDSDTFIESDDLGGGEKSLSELGLDKDFLGNTLLRKSLGYLSENDSMDIEDFTNHSTGSTKNNFLKIMRGKTDEVLKQIKQKKDLKEGDGDFQVYSYFTPAIDQNTGELKLKRVVGTKDDMAKTELAGSSIINSYGPKKFSTNFAIEGTKALTKGIMGIIPGIYDFAAGASDLAEAAYNLATKGKFESNYDSLNALADYRREEQNQDTVYGQTSSLSDQDLFSNAQSFASNLGQGISSLIQYATGARVLSGAANLMSLGRFAKIMSEGSKFANNMLMYSSGLLLNYGEAYQAARDANLPLETAASIGFITGALNTVVENKLGSNRLMEWLATGKSGSTAMRAIVAETGGDMSKLYDRGISNKIVNSVLNTADRLTANSGFVGRALGSALEEGTEEFLQSMVKSSIENLYDYFLAPTEATKLNGKFGTKFLSGEDIKGALEEGAVGAIIGALGGITHSATKEDRSIIPFIAAREYDALDAGLNMAKQKGALSDEQFNSIKARIEGLKNLREANQNLFANVAALDKSIQDEVGNKVMSALRDQDDYIKNTKNPLDDDFNSFVELLNKSNSVQINNGVVIPISTVDAFADKLEEAGRNTEAQIIRRSRNSAKKQAETLLPKLSKKATPEEKMAWLESRNEIEFNNYAYMANRLINRERLKQSSTKLITMLNTNNELRNAVERSLDKTYVDELNKLTNEISNAKDLDELQKAEQKAKELINKTISDFVSKEQENVDVEDYSKTWSDHEAQKINQRVISKKLELSNDKRSIEKNIVEKSKARVEIKEKIKKAIEEAKTQQSEEKKKQDYFTSDEYVKQLDSVINDENVSDEDKALYNRAKTGDIDAQFEIEKRIGVSLVKELNNTSVSEKEKRDNLKEALKNNKARRDYLEKKKKEQQEKAENDKFVEIKVNFDNVKTDEITDDQDNVYKIDPDKTYYSKNKKLKYTLIGNDGQTIEVSGLDLKKYKLKQIKGSDITLMDLAKVHQRIYLKSITPLNPKDSKKNQEPIEDKTNKTQQPKSKTPNVSNNLRLAASPKFQEELDKGDTDFTKKTATVGLSENIENQEGYKEEKWAKKEFEKLLNEEDPLKAFNNLRQSVRDAMWKYLPIQITIEGFKSDPLYTFSDNKDEKLKLIVALLKNKGKFVLPAGSLSKTPGYINYIPGSKMPLTKALKLTKVPSFRQFSFPLEHNGKEVQPFPLMIGVADASGIIKYRDPRDSTIKTANANGTPGTPYLILPDYVYGKEGYVAKLNPNKITLKDANALANLFAMIAKGNIAIDDIISEQVLRPLGFEFFTRIPFYTYESFINQIIFFGDATKNENRGENKELYFDNNGVLHYSSNNTILDPTSEDSIRDLASFIATNKNYAIDLDFLLIDEPSLFFKTPSMNDLNSGEYTSYLSKYVVSTDLNIENGLTSKSYLQVKLPDNVNSTSAVETNTNKKVEENKTLRESAQVYDFSKSFKFSNFEKGNNSDMWDMLGDGSQIRLSFNKVFTHKNTFAEKTVFTKKGEYFVSDDGKIKIAISNVKNDITVLQKALVDYFNEILDKNDQIDVVIDGKKETVNTAGLKIPELTLDGTKIVKNPEYYKSVKTFKITRIEPSESTVKTENKSNSSEKQSNKAGEIKKANNPFLSLEQTDEVKRLGNIYQKLLDYFSQASSKELYISYLRSMVRNPKDIPPIGLTKQDLIDLFDYTFEDGSSPYTILMNYADVVGQNKPTNTTDTEKQEKQKQSQPKNDSTERSKPVENKKDTTSENNNTTKPKHITTATSVLSLADYAKDKNTYDAIVKRLREEYEELDENDLKEIEQQLNEQLNDTLDKYKVKVVPLKKRLANRKDKKSTKKGVNSLFELVKRAEDSKKTDKTESNVTDNSVTEAVEKTTEEKLKEPVTEEDAFLNAVDATQAFIEEQRVLEEKKEADLPNTESVKPISEEERLLKQAGLTPYVPGAKQKGKKKFSSFGKPKVPMQVQDSNQQKKRSARQEALMYRRLLSEKAGGKIEFVDKLIKIVGESGRPAWAWSVMHQDGVTLTEELAEGAAYHEAFHRVSLLLLTPEERQQLYNLLKKEYNLYGRSDYDVEEFAAERFREFMLDSDFESQSKLKRFFSNIYNFIKSFLGLNKAKLDNINGFFNSIKNGKYKFAKVNKAALTEFNLRYAENDVPLTINGVTLHEIYNSFLLSNIVNTLTSMVIDVNGIQDIESLEKGLSYKPVLDELISIRNNFKEAAQNVSVSEFDRAAYQEKVNMYDEIIENFHKVFIPLIDTKLQGYNIRKVEQKLEDKDDLNDLINDEIHSSYEFSAKENAQADIRIMFLTLRKSSKLNSDTFLPEFYNPETAWFNTFSAIHGAKSVDEMIQILKNKSEETNTLRQSLGDTDEINMYSELYERLTASDENGNQDEMLKTRFWNTFKKHRNNFTNAYFEKDKSSNGKTLNSYNMRFGDADLNKRSRKLERNWSNAFGIKRTYADKELLQEVVDDFKSYLKYLRTSEFKNSSYKDNVSKLVSILQKININVNPKTIGLILNKYYFNTDLNSALKNFVEGNIKVGETNEIPIQQLFGEKGVLQKLIKGQIDNVNEKALNLLSNEKVVRKLAEAYVDANPTAEDDSVIGPGGNLVYSYSEYNTITSMFEDWIKDEAYLAQLNGVTYSKSSLWLSQLVDEAVRNNVQVDTMLAMLDLDNYDTGRGYLEIAPNEDLLLKFNAILNNKMILPTLANKRTYYFISGLKRLNVRLKDGKLNKEAIDAFVNYAINEYMVIKEANEAKNNFLSRVKLTESEWNSLTAEQQKQVLKDNNTDYKDLVENYHYNMKGDTMRLGGNGYKFRYFNSLTDKINDESFFDANNSKLRNRIEKALIQQINNTIKLFINQKLIRGNNRYQDFENIKETDNSKVNTDIIFGNSLLPNKLLKSKNADQDIASAIADYAINSAICTLEFEKIVSGDVAYYKSKNYQAMLDDRVKRYSALTSTKSVLRQDFPDGFVDFDTEHYRTAIFGTDIIDSQAIYEELYNKYVGTKEQPGILMNLYKKFREEGRDKFANLTDEELEKLVIEDTEKRLINYHNVDQTDAQVYISPKMFRKLSIMNGEWNEQKEDAYNLLESDDELTLEEELQAYSVIMQPLKYIHFGYDFFNNLQVPIYDKMSLATVFKRMAKNRDLQDLYNLMKDQDIDMIKLDTATKSGNRQKDKLYKDGKLNPEISNIPVYKQSFRYLGKQLVTDPHHVSRIAMGTQMVKIGVAGVEDSAIYDYNGKQVSGEYLIKEYVDTIAKLSNIGTETLYNRFGLNVTKENGETTFTLDKAKFVKMLREDAISSDMPANLINALNTITNEDGSQDYYVQLSGIPALSWIQSRILSMIKKEVIDVNTPGGAMIQMSNFAFKNSTVEVDMHNYNYKTNGELRFKNENGRLEAIVSINLFKDVLPKAYLEQLAKENKTTYFEEARKFILANKDLAALSYRIPTQGMNSTLAIEIVDVLESSVGDLIVLPKELTTLTGADFDIDKMYLARYNYNIVNGELEKVEFIDDVSEIDENGEIKQLSEDEYLEKVYNYKYRHYRGEFYETAKKELPKVLQAILVDINRNGTLTEETKEILKNAIQKYNVFFNEREIDNILNDSSLTDRQKIVSISKAFKLSSKVISLKAFKEQNKGKTKWDLNSKKQIENHLLDVFQSVLTSDNHFVDTTVPLDFTTSLLKEAVNVVDSFSNLNQNYTDVEPLFPLYQEGIKEQNTGADAGIGPMALINVFRVIMQIAKLKLNKDINLSINRHGKRVSRNLFRLIPGVNNLYEKYDNDGNAIMDWTSALINAHVDAAKDSYITRLNVNAVTYDIVSLLTSAGVGVNQFYFLPQPILKELTAEEMRVKSSKIGLSKKELRGRAWEKKIIDGYFKKSGLTKNDLELIDNGEYEIVWNGKNYLAQDLMFNKDWLIEQLAKHHDKKLDKQWYKNQIVIYNYFKDIQSYSKALTNLILASQVDTGKLGKNESEMILFVHNIERVLNDPHFVNANDIFDKTFLGEKLKNVQELFFGLLKNEVAEFNEYFLNTVNFIGKLTDTYFDRKTDNINQYLNMLKYQIQLSFFDNYCKQNNINLQDMFFGDNTLVDRFERLKNQIMTGSKYQELQDNFIFQTLNSSIIEEDKPKHFDSLMKLRDVESKNAFTYAWKDLLEHRSKEIRDFARDLIVFAMYTGGSRSTGLYSFTDLIPLDVLNNLEIRYSDTLLNQRNIKYGKYFDELIKDGYSLINADVIQDTMLSLTNNNNLIEDLSDDENIQMHKELGNVFLFVPKKDMLNQSGLYKIYFKYDNRIYALRAHSIDTLYYTEVTPLGYSDKGFNIGMTHETMFKLQKDVSQINNFGENVREMRINDIFDDLYSLNVRGLSQILQEGTEVSNTQVEYKDNLSKLGEEQKKKCNK